MNLLNSSKMKTCSKCGCIKEDNEFIKKEIGRPICKVCKRIRSEQLRIKKHVEEEGYVFTTVEQYRLDMKAKRSASVRRAHDKYGLPIGIPHNVQCSIRDQIKKNNYVFTTVEQFEKDIKIRKNNYKEVLIRWGKDKRKYDYTVDENTTNAQQQKMYAAIMTKSYICRLLKQSTSEVPDEVVETTRNILMLKRELKIGPGIKR